jgi:predicted  nucleic acid-binding Zn-ribbon protein
MNNLSTEHLARQILGQLEAHVRGSKENHATLELRMQEIEKQAAKGEESTMSAALRSEVDEHILSTGRKIRDSFIQTNGVLVDRMNSLRTDVDMISISLQKLRADLDSSKASVLEETESLRTQVGTINTKSQEMREDISASKTEFTKSTESLRDELNGLGLTLQNMQEDITASKTSCKEATASVKAEVKALKPVAPEKRKLDSSAPVKTNGHKRRRARASIDDTDDET